ncbi:PREDICTED: uncharacterized protein LOC109125554 [Camelina sativa]|uniref:Uncharacterized protein LOC109125554 n=1 Tax=Camelina sativa TaxID=90675 RepID=A0ABM1Q817_CAMSA|nr:PREDICTED: uncharacterized protein LOC109125554 [Camelina sativa]
MKDLGNLKYFLGLDVLRGPDGFCLSQRKYALDILEEPVLSRAFDNGPAFDSPEQYHCMIGRLIYLTITRLDLCYAVHILSQFMKQPIVAHWEVVLRLVIYLKGSLVQGILLGVLSNLAFSLGLCHLFGLFSYLLKNQEAKDCLKFFHAEYRAMAHALKEIQWLKALLI